MRIFISGPIRGIPGFNVPAFRRAAELIRDAGYPDYYTAVEAGHCDGNDKPDAIREYLAEDLAWLCANADAVVLMPGWEKSAGCLAEIATARALGVPVYELAAFLFYGEQAALVP